MYSIYSEICNCTNMGFVQGALVLVSIAILFGDVFPLDNNSTENEILTRRFEDLRVIDEKFSKCGKNNVDIRELGIVQALSFFASGRLLATELTLCYLRRIEEMNPVLRAVAQINPDAIRQALKADFRIMLKLKTGLLNGVPVLIKDNIGTNDGLENSAGSPALIGLKPKAEAPVVTKLRQAGAVILGKSSMSEFAGFRGTNVPSGWSGVGGQALCPYKLFLDPTGSSTGSAVAMATNLALLALGTETDGSIAGPSSRQSLFGLKPTLNGVSTKGVVPLSFSQDTVGPFSRTAKGAAIAFEALREDTESSYSVPYDSSKTLRVGVLREYFWDYKLLGMESQKPILEAALVKLEASEGVVLVDPVKAKSNAEKDIWKVQEFTVQLHEFKHSINEYLANDVKRSNGVGSDIRTLKDIVKYNKDHNLTAKYNQELLELADLTDGIANRTYLEYRENILKGSRDYLDYIFDKYNLDAIVGPSDHIVTSTVVLTLARVWSLAAISGYPSFTVPVGLKPGGIPIGLSFVGKPNTERALLRLGEFADGLRQRPKFLT